MLRTGGRAAGAPALILVILAMVVVPLPPLALDALFTFNIAISLVMLLAVVYVARPLEFSAFPTILLMVTMLRLGLNVASTRIILMEGHTGPGAAGQVIETFGHFVIGGSYAVGLIVFIILTIINFVVVTKGAGRVSEVSARFILDALPGKQMAIDADLNAGLLTREEAKARREEVREEADFFGSMDGASKFVRGDAIAGILIIVINIVGGLLIGILQHGLSAGDAARIYTLLTIGDGLVAQIPALLVSTAVAMLVTRASRPADLGSQVGGQMFGRSEPLLVSAAVLGIAGLVPGMPNAALLLTALVVGAVGFAMRRIAARAAAAAAEPALPAPRPEGNPELSWDDVQPIDALGLEVGYRLIPLVDRNAGGELMARIKGVRRKLTGDLGFLVPAVHIRDNLELAPGGYRILLHGAPIAAGQVMPERELALNPGRVFGPVDGIPTKDPAFGLDAFWILPAIKPQAQSQGYTVVDPATVIATHLSHVIKEHAHELLGHEEVQALLANLAKVAPKLVEDLTPKLLQLACIARVLQNLLFERVPVKHFRRIVEALLEHAAQTQDPAVLTAMVRIALGRQIVQEINGVAPELPVYTLDPQLERVLQDSVGGGAGAIEPNLAERMQRSLGEVVRRQEMVGDPAVLLVPGTVRTMLARMARHAIPGLHVLAYHEVPEDKRLRVMSAVG
ncbi:MAG: flagellar biosynthesis protein FlhA [Xanthomonadaceae bacterium]|nr:flagellar biosynthesis protein FlhA [Xanthomonadaceae bacterium]